MPGMLINYRRNEVARAFFSHPDLTKESARGKREGSTAREGTDGRRSGKKPYRARRVAIEAS